VLINRLSLVELALALKVQRQAVQVAHHRIAHRHPAEAVEGHVQLTLTLKRQAHHAVGFCRLLVRLELAGLGHQETLGGKRQVPRAPAGWPGNTSLSHIAAPTTNRIQWPAGTNNTTSRLQPFPPRAVAAATT
jgi:hypothetical protein